MKFILRTLLLAAIVLIVVNNLFAQSPVTGGSIIVEPSPHVLNGLTTTGKDMVDLYTGTLNYSVDLMTLPSRQLNLPISINYNSNNVKVNTVASQVGLGWSMSAGGSIGRVMRGLPDEYDGEWCSPYDSECLMLTAKGYLNLPGDYADKDTFLGLAPELRRDIVSFSNKTGPIRGSNLPEIWDTEPDEFYFNAMGLSGKFVFDKDGEPAIIPYQNLKIEVFYGNNLFGENNKHITGFLVTDENGVTYRFGKYDDLVHLPTAGLEKTRLSVYTTRLQCGYMVDYEADELLGTLAIKNESVAIADPSNGLLQGQVSNLTMTPHVSSWQLLEVSHPNGDWIKFEYSTSDEDISYISSHDQSISQPNLSRYKVYSGSNQYRSTHQFSRMNQPLSETANGNYQPQNITLTTNYISASENLVSRIYNSAGHMVNFYYSNRKDLNNGRKLDRLELINNQNTIVDEIDFNYSYQKSHEGPDQEVEFYGYNIYDNYGVSHIVTYLPMNDEWVNRMSIADSYRLVLNRVNEHNLLKASFSYYPGTLPRRNSYKQDRWGGYNDNNAGHRLANESYLGHHYFSDFMTSSNGLAQGMDRDGDQVIDETVIFRIDKSNTFDNPLISSVTGTAGTADLSANEAKSKVAQLKTVTTPTNGNVTFEYELNNVGGSNAGGLRVSQIERNPATGAPINEHFEYENGSIISQVNLSETRSLYQNNEVYHHPDGFDVVYHTTYADAYLSSSPMRSVSYERGGATVGYGKVNHLISGQGKTEYIYYYSGLSNDDVDYGIENSVGATFRAVDAAPKSGLQKLYYPWVPHTDLAYLRGVTDKITQYDQEGNILRVKDYKYEIYNAGTLNKKVYGLKPGMHKILNDGLHLVTEYYAGFYEYSTNRMVLIEKNDTIYDNNKLDDIHKFSQRTTFDYSEESTKLKESKVFLSDEDSIITKYKYVDDLKDLITTGQDEMTMALKTMADNHINAQIETSTYKFENSQEKALSAELITYKSFDNGGSGINVYPDASYKTKIALPSATFDEVSIVSDEFVIDEAYDLTPEVRFQTYDQFGNITKQETKDGIVTDYAWGYENSLLTSMTTGSLTTTYTHTPLIGVTKITDPNGQETSYEYDEFNRLKNIKDHNGDIVEHYRYNYGGQYDISQKSLQIDGCVWPGKTDIIDVPSGFFVPYGEVEYVWNFGDNTVIETTENIIPEHSYSADGTYNLTVTRTSGQFYGTQSISQQVTVDNGTITIRQLTKVPTGIPHVYDVTLGAQESLPECNPIQSRIWYTSRDNQLTYQQVGTDETVDITAHQGLWAKLVATTEDGRVFTDEHVFNDYSYMGWLELAALSINSSESCVLKGLNVGFSTSEYVVVDGPIEMVWDFGDGTVITNNHVNAQQHTYTSSGTYTVKLRIAYRENGEDGHVELTKTVEVTDNDSAIGTLARTIQVLEHGATYRVDAQVDLYHDVNCVDRIEWFIDGVLHSGSNNSSSINVLVDAGQDKFIKARVYDIKGDHIETATIAVGDGALSDEFMTINELNAIDMNGGGSCNLIGESLSFNRIGALDLPNPYTETWDFGDGTVVNDNSGSVSHTYSNTGTYQVKLTISSLIYPDKVITQNVTVLSNSGKIIRLIGEFTEGPHGGEIDAQYALDNHSISCIKRYEWYVNGVQVSNNSATYGFFMQVNETKVVKVKVIDEANNEFLSNEVTQGSPTFMTQAQFNAVSLNASSSCYVTGNPVTFNFSQSVSLAGSSSLAWNFKDGSTLNSGSFAGRSHSYSQTGTFNVSVAISNDFYDNRTLTKSVTINSPATYSISHSFIELVGGTGLANFEVVATKTSGTACGNVRWEERRSGSSTWTTISDQGSSINYAARDGDQLRLKGTSQTITFVVDGGPPPGPGEGEGGFGK